MRLFLFLQNKGWLEQFNYWMNQGAADWMPRAHCVLSNPVVISLHIFSEALIAISYFSIPIILWYLASKRGEFLKEYKSLILMFGLFIMLCGITHFMGIIMFWYPNYWIDGALKLTTGLVSLFTAIALWKIIPKIMEFPTQSELHEALKAKETAQQRVAHLERLVEKMNDDSDERITRLRQDYEVLQKAMKDKGLDITE